MEQEKIRLDTLAFRATLQIVSCESNNVEEIEYFGSGFLLQHKGRLFFVTADHNVHPDDHGDKNEGYRSGKENVIQIITNVKPGESGSINLLLGSFYSSTTLNFEGLKGENPERYLEVLLKVLSGTIDKDDESIPIDLRIPTLLDLSICEIKDPLQYPLLSNMVVDDLGNIIVEEGSEKLVLDANQITSFNEQDRYIVAGTIRNEIKNTIVLDRMNAFYHNIAFVGYDNEKNALLEIEEEDDIKREDMAGLSGAPILNEKGLLAGMSIKHTPSTPKLVAIPVNKIIWFIDRFFDMEKIKSYHK